MLKPRTHSHEDTTHPHRHYRRGGGWYLSAKNTGSTLNANAGTTVITSDQTLAALNISPDAIVTLGGQAIGAPAAPVPEPNAWLLAVLSLAVSAGRRPSVFSRR